MAVLGVGAVFPDVDGFLEALREQLMRNKLAVDHGADVRPIVSVEALELADDHVDNVQHRDVEVLKGLVEIRTLMPGRHMGQKREATADDIDVEAVALMEDSVLPPDRQQLLLGLVAERCCLEHVAVLGATPVVGLEHERSRANDGQELSTLAQWLPRAV